MAATEPFVVRANKGIPLGFSIATMTIGLLLAAFAATWLLLIPAAAFVLMAVGTLRTTVRITDDGVSARDTLRRRTWTWQEIDEVVLTMGTLPFFSQPYFSQLSVVIATGASFPVRATIAMSPARAREVIKALAAHGCSLDEYVDPSYFPMGWSRAMCESRDVRRRQDLEAWAADEAAKRSPDYDGWHLPRRAGEPQDPPGLR